MSAMGRRTRSALYERLHVQITELREQFGGLPAPHEARAIWHDIWLDETHHSTAIEGNALVLRQVAHLLDEGRALGNKQLREYLEVRGYANAAEWVYRQAVDAGAPAGGELVTLTEIRHVHALALGLVWEVAPHPAAGDDERPGAFRRHDIEPFPGGMKPPSWTEVPVRLDEWLTDARALSGLDAPRLPAELAWLHARFEQVHPFLDGNGRTGRLLLNLLLVRRGYPPAIIRKRDRERYLAALRHADGGDCGPLGEFLARAILDNLHRFLLPVVAGKEALVPLPALARERLSANALRVAAVRGRLEAVKGRDGLWRSSQAWVDEYAAGRYRRG
ncbi:MAG TPA: Fic family protein [Conexibacter sp.]|nr:Fic family protein [Conexibacter sp.]